MYIYSKRYTFVCRTPATFRFSRFESRSYENMSNILGSTTEMGTTRSVKICVHVVCKSGVDRAVPRPTKTSKRKKRKKEKRGKRSLLHVGMERRKSENRPEVG